MINESVMDGRIDDKGRDGRRDGGRDDGGKEGWKEGSHEPPVIEPAVTHCDHWRAEMSRGLHTKSESAVRF